MEQEIKRSGKSSKGQESGILQAQKILLTWILDEPELLDKISTVINEDDFSEPVYNKVAALLFAQIRAGDTNPAKIIDQFESEEEHREVSALFHMPLREELSRQEKEKALNETVLRIRRHSLEEKSRKVTDVKELQDLIRQQQKLQSVKISL
jgi:DNA primase